MATSQMHADEAWTNGTQTYFKEVLNGSFLLWGIFFYQLQLKVQLSYKKKVMLVKGILVLESRHE